MGCVISHTRENLHVEEEENKKLEAELKALRAKLVIAAKKEKEGEDVDMGATGSSPPICKSTTDAATNTEKKTYAQATVHIPAKGPKHQQSHQSFRGFRSNLQALAEVFHIGSHIGMT